MMRSVLALIFLVSAASCSVRRNGLSYKKDGKSIVGVIGGREVTPHSHPYVVWYKTFGECQGALLSQEYVLTIAQCVADQDEATVVMGAHNIEKNEPEQVVVKAKEFIVHEDFDKNKFLNDIALIKLSPPINFTFAIQPALLPTADIEDGTIAVLTGWGVTSESSDYYSDVLREGKVTISPTKNCSDYYGSATPHTICVMTGSGSAPFCDGDFGGSLYYKGAVHGLASYYSSSGCDSDGGDVYTRVYDFVDWIKEKTGL